MAVLNVVKLFDNNYYSPHCCLREKCNPVTVKDLKSGWVQELVKDMFETLYTAPAGIGLSANQVGVLSCITVIDTKRDAKSPMVLLNPVYSPLSEEKVASDESCISVPLKTGTVNRFKSISVEYMDLHGNKHTIIAEGLKAKVLQHEIDHLYGILYIDLVPDIKPNLSYPARLSIKAYNKVEEEQ